MEHIPLYVKSEVEESVVRTLEETLKTNALYDASPAPADSCYLVIDGDGLALAEDGRLLRGDFARLLPRLTPNNLNHELLITASRIKGRSDGLTAVDATAGLGEDGFLLAAAGFHVRLYERNPVIAALLYDALRRAEDHPDLSPIVRRMELRAEDSIAALPRLDPPPDVVLLDPMFPPRRKSGLVRKKFQMLHQLELPCSEEGALLHAAILCGPRRIVIKRPLKGPYLAGVKPGYSLKGRAIRYDCIVSPRPSAKTQGE